MQVNIFLDGEWGDKENNDKKGEAVATIEIM